MGYANEHEFNEMDRAECEREDRVRDRKQVRSHTAFTPGPWEVWDAVEGNTAKLHVGIVSDGHYVRLASVPNMSMIGEDHANARLIAAAPEMLAALQLVRMSLGWQYLAPESKAIIEAAIQKAKGGR